MTSVGETERSSNPTNFEKHTKPQIKSRIFVLNINHERDMQLYIDINELDACKSKCSANESVL